MRPEESSHAAAAHGASVSAPKMKELLSENANILESVLIFVVSMPKHLLIVCRGRKYSSCLFLTKPKMVITKWLMVFLLLNASCFRSKPSKVLDEHQNEAFMKDSVFYYPIKNNRITVDVSKLETASLFDYFSHIELIPLETRRDALIGRHIEKIIFHQDQYYILCGQQHAVLIFDVNGNFIEKIRRIGNGPGEYLMLYDIIINPFTGNLDFLCPFTGRVNSYDLSGKHIWTSERISYQDTDLSTLHRLFAISENIYIFYTWRHASQHITYYNIAENRIFHRERDYKDVSNNTADIRFYEYNGQWYLYSLFDYSVYSLGRDSLLWAYEWDFGKPVFDADNFVLTEQMKGDYDTYLAEIWRRYPYMLINQGQNNRYVISRVIRGAIEYSYLIYDKMTNESKFIGNFIEAVNFLPRIVTNDYVLAYYRHEEVHRFITEEMLDEENRNKLNIYLDSKIELNPVIVKYHFK